jgi:hypothetical protein
LTVFVCIFLADDWASAQGTNGRPRPFEPGYFPGFDQPHVVATTADMEVTTDDRALTSSYPVDDQIVRIVMVKNTSSTRIRVPFTASITITPFEPDLFGAHPQPSILYLDPGQAYPIRLQYEIPTDSRAPAWSVGDQVSVPMTLTLQEQSVTTGQNVGTAVTVQLPNIVSVVRPPQATAFDPDPPSNATITGTVRDADTLNVFANTPLLLDSGGFTQHVSTDANGRFTATVFAYKRPGGAPDWREFGLQVDGSDHSLDAQALVIPKAGETTTFDTVVAGPRPMADYVETGSLNLGLNAYAWDASADGTILATVPFHSGLSQSVIEARAFVDAFTSDGKLLWRFPLREETPAIDVSDDGQFVATTRRPASETGPQDVTGGEAIVINRAGQLVLTIPEFAAKLGAFGPEDRTTHFTEVRMSHDNRYLALGDGEGRLFLFDRLSGSELWRVFTKGQVRRIDFDTNDARIFVSSGDGYLRAFDLTGSQLWQTWVDSWLTASDVSAHFILASSKAARQGLHLINKVTGATVWSYQVESIASQVRIAPDESYVWYGTFGGASSWLPKNAMFTIDGFPIRQLARANLSAADAGAITADSQLIAYTHGCTMNVSDRAGRPVFRSAELGVTDDSVCSGQFSHMLWVSPDGSRIVAAVGPRDVTNSGNSVYFFTGPKPSELGNVSTRLPVGTGDNVLIEGFIVQGPAGSTKKIIVRAIGPSLIPFGISDALANPTLEIHDSSGATIATNNDWRTTQIGGLIPGDQSAEIGASGLAPGNDLESAIIASLAPGSYTAVVRGFGNTVGTGVVDAYDLSAGSPAKLANIATRGLIQPGDKLMIAGFIVQNGPARVVVSALGPSLSAFGINNALPDTTLQIRDQNGGLVVENDNWKLRSDGSSQQAELEATGLQPTNDLEAAVLTTLQPGQYTAQVRGKPESTGIGVVQVYFLQ